MQRDRSKHGPTPKRAGKRSQSARLRLATPDGTLTDALICEMTADCTEAELDRMIRMDVRQVVALVDGWARQRPDDIRFDAWRRYRAGLRMTRAA
jgi:hypothetical protein